MDSRTRSSSPNDAAHSRAAIALRAALTLLLPLARWLLRNGVHYASFAPAVKQVFVDAARLELAATGAKITDSSVSVLSGVHRRDLRDSRAQAARAAEGDAAEAGSARVKTPSVVSQAFTRWITDPDYRDHRNRPMALPRSGPAPSFDSLARLVSSDVHPRTLLAEMKRLNLLDEEAEGTVTLRVQAFLPQQGFDGDAAIFSANVADHIAAAAHNLGTTEGRFLEQSMYGSGLTPQSISALGDTARALWSAAFEQIVREATRRYEGDRAQPDAHMRMRFGVYYYAEPVAPSAAQDGPEATAQ